MKSGKNAGSVHEIAPPCKNPKAPVRRVFLVSAISVLGLIVISVLGFSALMAGCRGTGSQTTTSSGNIANGLTELQAGWDESASQNPAARALAFGVQNRIVDEIIPPRTKIHAWAFAAPGVVRPQWDSRIEDADELLNLEEKLRDLPPVAPGTYCAPLLQAMVKRTRVVTRGGGQVAIAILTDGGWNDYKAAKAAADQLTKLPVKAVFVAPVTKVGTARGNVEGVFSGFDHEKVVIVGADEVEQGLARFRELVRK